MNEIEDAADVRGLITASPKAKERNTQPFPKSLYHTANILVVLHCVFFQV